MKRKIIFISKLFLAIIVVGCGTENKKTTTEYSSEVIDTTTSIIEDKEFEPHSSIEETAIGNIHMNIDEIQFEIEKDEFLNNHSILGGLKIKSLTGFFYDNRLAAIEIISEQQDIHRRILEHDINEEGWYIMYKSKYQLADFKDTNLLFPFGCESTPTVFKKDKFLIEVSDLCDSPNGHNSFEDIYKSPQKQCYGHNLMPLELDNSNNISRLNSVNRLFGELPKERANYLKSQYNLEKKRINTDNLMVKITQENALDEKYFNSLLPEVQAHRNYLLNLHKNDPSWSFIIICYKPLLEKYHQDQKFLKEKRNQEKARELDII